jgi:hypothetical protein
MSTVPTDTSDGTIHSIKISLKSLIIFTSLFFFVIIKEHPFAGFSALSLLRSRLFF